MHHSLENSKLSTPCAVPACCMHLHLSLDGEIKFKKTVENVQVLKISEDIYRVRRNGMDGMQYVT